MCGIVYNHNFEGAPVNDSVLAQYEKQKNRGQAGFGVFDGEKINIKKASKEKKFLSWLRKYPSNIILAHHRFPTSTVNVKRAAHPFSTRKYFGDNQYVLVHNGVLNNSEKMKEAHEAIGIEYQSVLADGSFNDSEALLWDVALYLEGESDELFTAGSIAFICAKLHKGKLVDLYFGRNNGNPLKLEFDDEHLELSSEGWGENIMTNFLYKFDYDTKELSMKPLEIPRFIYDPSTTAVSTRTVFDDYDDEYWANYRAGDYESYPSSHLADHSTGSQRLGDIDGFDWQQAFVHSKSFEDDEVREEDIIRGARELEEDEVIDLRHNEAYQKKFIQDSPSSLAADSKEIQQWVMAYLKMANGYFDTAIEMMELDLDINEQHVDESPDDDDARHVMVMLKAALTVINNDPEYTAADAVSSLVTA